MYKVVVRFSPDYPSKVPRYIYVYMYKLYKHVYDARRFGSSNVLDSLAAPTLQVRAPDLSSERFLFRCLILYTQHSTLTDPRLYCSLPRRMGTGDICLSILKEDGGWRPGITVKEILTGLQLAPEIRLHYCYYTFAHTYACMCMYMYVRRLCVCVR